MTIKLAFSIIILLFSKQLLSQSVVTFETLLESKLTVKTDPKKPTKPNSVFKFYKNFISSQDGNSCGFYPSCSQFAVESIKSKGFFLGTLAAFDRISRCNGHNARFYLTHQHSLKQLDLAK